MNSYNIPNDIEEKIRTRDKKCVYCGKAFDGDETIEHIDNNIKNISLENLAICCRACNTSKGQKKVSEWLKSDYCKRKNITSESVADVIKNTLK